MDELSARQRVSPAAYARACVEAFVRGGRAPQPPDDQLYERLAACFVSIKTRDGDLRGCIGTLTPCEPRLGEEIARNAYAAAFCDPRFNPVRPHELPALTYSVDVLSDSERATMAELDPAHYGVIVSHGHRRGVLLPDLPTVTTTRQQVGIALQKAGIAPDEDYELARFTVERFREVEDAGADSAEVGACRSDERVEEGEVTCAPADEAGAAAAQAGVEGRVTQDAVDAGAGGREAPATRPETASEPPG
jgi:AmmeMemoRadiSam system protein A